MDRLVRLRQREARRGGEQRVVTTLSCLPAELLGNVVEFACPYEVYGDLGILSNCSSWLSSLLHVGCTNSSFLEALKYISGGRTSLELTRICFPRDATPP